MTARPAKGFAVRPGDATRWIRSPGPGDAERARPMFTARLTIDVTPELRRRLKLAALIQGCSVADMLRGLFEREFPDSHGEKP